MSSLLVLDESIEVDRPVHEVFAYVCHFSRIEEWDPAVATATKLTRGAPAVGSEYRIDMKAGFSLHYRTIEFNVNHSLVMDVKSRLFNALEEISFEVIDPNRTRIRYIAKFELPTLLATANRFCPAVMSRVAESTMKGLKAALEDRFEAPSESARLALADRLVLPGIWRFTRFGYSVSRKHWKPVSAYLGNQHAVITGATSGVGLAAARALASMGARVTLVARDEEKAREVARDIQTDTGNDDVRIEISDMSDMSDVHSLVDRLVLAGDPIDMLINNAGALFSSRCETKDGLEKSFALLLLAPYILTERLQPLLQKSGAARVVNVCSGGMYTQKLHIDDLQSESTQFSGSVAYARAKRGLMILTELWADKWRDEGITVNAMHPGWADTPGVESALPGFYKITRKLLRTAEEGADTAVWLAASTEAAKVSGKLWLDREQHPSHLSERTRESAADRVALQTELTRLLKATQ